MSGYYTLPERVAEVANRVAPTAAIALEKHWAVLMLGFQVAGSVLVIHSLLQLNKKYKYNQPSYGEYKIALIILGVIMVNMNHFLEMFMNTVL